ncbi:MAG: hypothetical protein C0501_13495 [Isosphaera sp.]|nr:hypothetical protein [Isosphaera sp.]
MIEQLAGPLASAAVLIGVIVYSAWRARRESTALTDRALAASAALTAATIARLRATAAREPADEPEPVGELGPIRAAFGSFVRDDDLALLRQTLGAGQPVEDAGRALGLSPEQSRARFAEALGRLRAFAAAAEGFAPPAGP